MLAIIAQGRSTIVSEASSKSPSSPNPDSPDSQQGTPRSSQNSATNLDSRPSATFRRNTQRTSQSYSPKRPTPYARPTSSPRSNPSRGYTPSLSSPRSIRSHGYHDSPRLSPQSDPSPWTSPVPHPAPAKPMQTYPCSLSNLPLSSATRAISPLPSTRSLPPAYSVSHGLHSSQLGPCAPDNLFVVSSVPDAGSAQDRPDPTPASNPPVWVAPLRDVGMPSLNPRRIKSCLYAFRKECVSCWLNATGTSATHSLFDCPEGKATGRDLSFSDFKDEIHYPQDQNCYSCGLELAVSRSFHSQDCFLNAMQWSFPIPERARTYHMVFHPKYKRGHRLCSFRDTLTPLAYLVWSSLEFRKRLTGAPGTAGLNFETLDKPSYIRWLTGEIKDEYAHIAPPMLVIMDRFLAWRGDPLTFGSYRGSA